MNIIETLWSWLIRGNAGHRRHDPSAISDMGRILLMAQVMATARRHPIAVGTPLEGGLIEARIDGHRLRDPQWVPWIREQPEFLHPVAIRQDDASTTWEVWIEFGGDRTKLAEIYGGLQTEALLLAQQAQEVFGQWPGHLLRQSGGEYRAAIDQWRTVIPPVIRRTLPSLR